MKYTREDIIRMVEEEDVEFIRLQFTDIFGTMKNIAVTSSQLEKTLDEKCMFDGSSIEGFVRVEESDVYRPDGTPFEGDSRYILKKVIKEAADMGYQFDVGPECEFFLYHLDDNGQPTTITHEKAGYFDLGPVDLGENARRDMVMTLEDVGIGVEASHHEVAPAQHEIDLKYGDALTMADNLMTFKFAVKTIAKRHGLHASFMPKPKQNINGSGMHINMSLSRNGVNIFADPENEKVLSKEARYFMGGLLKYMKGMAAITNPLINSYKRLIPGYEAPVYIAWSTQNRTPLIRIPVTRGERQRIELRSPDPASNPYLMLAVCLAAGLDGIRNQIEPPESVDGNLYELSEQEKKDIGLERLPENLNEAVRELEKSEFICNVLGEHIVKNYCKAKKAEWEEYTNQVTQWELDQYLYRI